MYSLIFELKLRINIKIENCIILKTHLKFKTHNIESNKCVSIDIICMKINQQINKSHILIFWTN